MSRKQNFILIQPKNEPLPLRKTTMITIIKTRSLIICSFVWWFSCIALPSYQLHSVYQKIKPINYVPQPSKIKTILFKTKKTRIHKIALYWTFWNNGNHFYERYKTLVEQRTEKLGNKAKFKKCYHHLKLMLLCFDIKYV